MDFVKKAGQLAKLRVHLQREGSYAGRGGADGSIDSHVLTNYGHQKENLTRRPLFRKSALCCFGH
jgi:hypothetical protein